uniref:Uncharacterized protein n=1 Tax=Candidatus Kentrum sp. FW TaxID=2126338 RepID=A0A450U4K3_9GAMM|nr:MAG: hypothetical protein BECKFW1821C_GA0114237_12022 [Candidatus Kentron sp. FW]
MGRIITQIEVTKPLNSGKSLIFSAFVDAGAVAVILLSSWESRFGEFMKEQEEELVLANNGVISESARGPEEIRIDGFREIFNEVIFMEIAPWPEFQRRINPRDRDLRGRIQNSGLGTRA